MLEAEALQGRRGEARAVTLVADDDDAAVAVTYLGYAVRAGGGESPLQNVSVNHDRPGKVSVSGALFRWASVDDKGPQGDLRREVDGLDPIQALTGSCEKLINVHSVHAATAAVMTVPAASLGWCRAGPG